MEACGLTDEPTDVAWTELWSLQGAITYFPPISLFLRDMVYGIPK